MSRSWKSFAQLPTALLLTLLAACGGGDDSSPPETDSTEPDPTEPGPPETAQFTLGGEVTGLADGEIVLGLYGDDIDAQQITVGNGTFQFPESLPDGAGWRLFAELSGNTDAQRCDPVPHTGAVDGADVLVTLTCRDAYRVSGRVIGLRGTGLVLQLARGGGPDPVEFQEAIEQDGDYQFHAGLLPGETYAVTVAQPPSNPTQRCTVARASGVVGDGDVIDVNVECGQASITYDVEGLLGSGLAVALFLEVTGSGGPQMLEIERDDIDADGEYTFHTLVNNGDRYEVRILEMPDDPNQICDVRNAEGEVNGDVTDVLVKCPHPMRRWRYDNEFTRETDTPLTPERTMAWGVVDDYFQFREGQVIALGSVSGLDTEELFQLYLDGPAAGGHVHSNLTGKTFWVAVESPPGENLDVNDAPHSHVVRLETAWRFRKVSQVANFALEITALNMLAFDDTHRPDAWGALWAGGEMSVRAHAADGADVAPEPFFSAHGGMFLKGEIDGGGPHTGWSLVPRTDPEALQSLWDELDFGMDVSDDNRVAYATLLHSIPIEIDISTLAVGQEFVIVADAEVEGRNSYSPEGATAAFLRDPAAFDPGQPPGGMNVSVAEGVALVETGDLTFEDLPFIGPAAPECPADAPRATLEFESDALSVEEGPNRGIGVRVMRSGSLEGIVTATVRLASGTATAGDDFGATDLNVRFGDGSDAPRTIELPIIDDTLAEEDETLTVTLVEPVGCADIGARDTVTVTIRDGDQSHALPTYTLGGTVTGLSGTGLTLTNLSTNELVITANGAFEFPRALGTGSRYEVRVSAQPTQPRQLCEVANGSGTIGSSDVTNLQVNCVTLPEGGGLDPDFGIDGRASAGSFPAATGMALQPDGRIVLVGRGRLGRFNADGTPDLTFGTNGEVQVHTYGTSSDHLNDVEVLPDGRIVIAGYTRDGVTSPSQEDWLIARYDAQGNVDATFAGGQVIVNFEGGDEAYDLLPLADGSLIVTGTMTGRDAFDLADANFGVARFLADGSSDTTFGLSGTNFANLVGRTDLARNALVQPDGAIVIVGRVANTGGDDPDIGLARFLADGTRDPDFGTDGVSVDTTRGSWDEAVDVELLEDGKLLVLGNAAAGMLAVYDADGAPDLGFGTNGRVVEPRMGWATAMARQADGRILVTGWGGGDIIVTRFHTDGQLDTTFGTDGVLTIDFFGGSDVPSEILVQPDGRILVAGSAASGASIVLALARIIP